MTQAAARTAKLVAVIMATRRPDQHQPALRAIGLQHHRFNPPRSPRSPTTFPIQIEVDALWQIVWVKQALPLADALRFRYRPPVAGAGGPAGAGQREGVGPVIVL